MAPSPDDKKPKSKFGAMTEEEAQKILDTEGSPVEKKITAAFNTSVGGWDKLHNIFFHLNDKKMDMQVVSEFRSIMGKGTSRAPLTTEEKELIAGIKAEALEVRKEHPGLTLEVAETLVFAAKITGVDRKAYVDQLVATDGNICGLNPDSVTKAGPFKFDVNTWLYMVKTHGAEHGLGFFADRIKLENGPDGNPVVSVDDPTVLREIIDLRNNPRLSAVMGAELVKAEQTLPHISYKGVTYEKNQEILDNQIALQKLGFDLGTKHADGTKGPLTIAATREFMHINSITDQTLVHDRLQAAVKKAEELAGLYRLKDGELAKVAPGKKAGIQDDGTVIVNLSVKDAFAMQLAHERTKVPFNKLLDIAIAERAFEAGKPNPGRSPGLFHISDGQWLMTVAKHGAKYGLGDIIGQMKIDKDKSGQVTNVTIADPLVRRYILDLRKDPRVSSLMAGERSKDYPIHLDVAECYMGETEDGSKSELMKFFKSQANMSLNPDTTHWCATFVNAVLFGTGVEGTRKPNARSFLDFGTPTKDPKAGDIVVFRRKGKEDPEGNWMGHVGFVADRYKENGVWKVKVLGGNQSDSVKYSVFTEAELLGYRRVPENVRTAMAAELTRVRAPAAPQPQASI
ncbi:MAG: TIGR02594 family protein [Alphaproteobacteria bacterium]